MIRKNIFNSQWLNYDVGFITDLNFFSLPLTQRLEILTLFKFVELRFADIPLKLHQEIHNTGFFYVDTQINFTLNLHEKLADETTQNLKSISATEQPFIFDIKDIHPFNSERFHAIPGITQAMIDTRYSTLANDIIQKHPECSLRIVDEDQTQGWYFSIPTEKGLELYLATLHKDAHIRGKQLYRKALSTYAQKFSTGFARFSVNNRPVHNMLSQFGAKFLDIETVWIWLNPSIQREYSR